MDELGILFLVWFCVALCRAQGTPSSPQNLNELMRNRQGFPSQVERSFFNPQNQGQGGSTGQGPNRPPPPPSIDPSGPDMFTVDRHLEIPTDTFARSRGSRNWQMEGSRQGRRESTIDRRGTVGVGSQADITGGMNRRQQGGVVQGQLDTSNQAQLEASGQTDVTVEGEALVPTRLLTNSGQGTFGPQDRMSSAVNRGQMDMSNQAQLDASRQTDIGMSGGLNQGQGGGMVHGQLDASRQAQLDASGQRDVTVQGEALIPTRLLAGAGQGDADASARGGLDTSGTLTHQGGLGVSDQTGLGTAGEISASNQATLSAGGQGEVAVEGEIQVPTRVLDAARRAQAGVGSEGQASVSGQLGATREGQIGMTRERRLGASSQAQIDMSGGTQIDASRERQIGASREAQLGVSHQQQLDASRGGQLDMSGRGQLDASRERQLSASRETQLGLSREQQLDVSRGRQLDMSVSAQLDASRERQFGASREAQIGVSREQQLDTSRGTQLDMSGSAGIGASRERQFGVSREGQLGMSRDRRLGLSQSGQIDLSRSGQLDASRESQIGASREGHIGMSRDRELSASQGRRIDLPGGAQLETSRERQLRLSRERQLGGQVSDGGAQLEASRGRQLDLTSQRELELTGPRGGSIGLSSERNLGASGEVSRRGQFGGSAERQFGGSASGQMGLSRDARLDMSGQGQGRLGDMNQGGTGTLRQGQISASNQADLSAGGQGEITVEGEIAVPTQALNAASRIQGGDLRLDQTGSLGLSGSRSLGASMGGQASVTGHPSGLRGRQIDLTGQGPSQGLLSESRQGQINSVGARQIGGAARQLDLTGGVGFDRGPIVGDRRPGGQGFFGQGQISTSNQGQLDMSGQGEVQIEGQIEVPTGLAGGQGVGKIGSGQSRDPFLLDLSGGQGQGQQILTGQGQTLGSGQINGFQRGGSVVDLTGTGSIRDRFPGGDHFGGTGQGQKIGGGDMFQFSRVSVNIRCYADPIKGLSCGVEFPDDQCKEKWDFPNPCTRENMDNNITKFVHPYDTSKFLMCGEMGKLYIVQCPQREIFHAGCGQCVDRSSGLTASCQEPLTPHVANPCTEQNIIDNKLYFPYPGNLAKYIHCDNWGKAWARRCTTGEVWSQWDLACIRPTLLNPCSRLKADLAYLYPHPCNPRRYLRCDNYGDAYEEFCDTNMAFNEAKQGCDRVGTFIGSDRPEFCENRIFGFKPGSSSGVVDPGFGRPTPGQLPSGTIGQPGTLPADKVSNKAGTLTMHRSKLRKYEFLENTPYAEPCTSKNVKEGRYHFMVKGDDHSYIQCDQSGISYLMPCPGKGTDSFDPWTNTCVDGPIHVDNQLNPFG